jgi:hypothetical protein
MPRLAHARAIAAPIALSLALGASLAPKSLAADAASTATASPASTTTTMTANAAHGPADGWTSTTHLGFGLVDRSSTGFDDVAGSVVFLDLAHALGPDLDVGLRTLAQGAKRPDSEFYRLGAGPFASLRLTEAWSVQVAVQVFKETGLGDDGEAAYHSRGRALMLGWERLFQITRRVELGWGGFAAWHQGDMSTVAGVAPQTSRRYEGVAHNVGMSRGVELALRLAL